LPRRNSHMACQLFGNQGDLQVQRVCGGQGSCPDDRQAGETCKRADEDKRLDEAGAHPRPERSGGAQRVLYHTGSVRRFADQPVFNAPAGAKEDPETHGNGGGHELSFFRRIRDIAQQKRRSGSAAGGRDSEALFSLSSSYITLETKLGLISTGRCSLGIKSVSGAQFYQMKSEVKSFLDSIRSEFDLIYSMTEDSYGYLWITFEARKIEDLLAGVTAVGDTILEKGFGNHILAAVFEFQNSRDREDSSSSSGAGYTYLIYSYKRDKFYPFVPMGNKKNRSTEKEMQVMATVANEMPFEKDMTLWYPLWDLPL